jgi:tRNA (cmo5U34)-methyltransferase
MRDELYKTKGHAEDFTFNRDVANVFDDMLNRSVPFYSEVQRMVVELGSLFLVGEGAVYDVGCSTGNTLLGFADTVGADKPIRFVGIEPAEAMREKAESKLIAAGHQGRVELLADPIENFERLDGARVIVMLYTLQFVRPIYRAQVLRMYFDSLEVGGCLLLAEKILADNSMLSRTYVDLYHDYKRRSGYSDTEIAKKREELENVLLPYRDSENIEMLRQVGFTSVDHVFRWYNFALYIALKG